MMIYSVFASLLSALIVSNLLTQGIGFESLDNHEKRLKPVLIKTSVISLLSLLMFVVYYGLNVFVLKKLNLEYLGLIVIVGLMIGLNELYLLLQKKLKLNLPKENHLVFHSIILIIGMLGFNDLTFGIALVSVLGSLMGFILLSCLFTVLINRLNTAPIIKSFKGLPILLIILGVIVLMLNGLGGIF
ncbi:MAG: hypothetical protein WC907_02800 [Acholeplasmataceae bacterium]